METHPNGEAIYAALGAPGVPVLLVDDQTIVGMNVRGWIAALAEPDAAASRP